MNDCFIYNSHIDITVNEMKIYMYLQVLIKIPFFLLNMTLSLQESSLLQVSYCGSNL